MYLLSGIGLESLEQNHGTAVAGERLVSVLALFVSNCKWQSTVRIQSVIGAHAKYTLWRVQVYGYQWDLLYRTVYCEYGACLMATNCSVRDKITQHFWVGNSHKWRANGIYISPPISRNILLRFYPSFLLLIHMIHMNYVTPKLAKLLNLLSFSECLYINLLSLLFKF